MSAGDPIRLLLVDDHLIVRRGLADLLAAAPDVAVIGEAENGEEALHLCQKLRPDLVLMDMKMPGMGGKAAVGTIRTYHPAIRVIGLSAFAEPEAVTAMIAAGASAHLPKSVTFAELIETVRRVHAGASVSAAVKPPSGELQRGQRADGAALITPQQRRVLALLAKGFTNPEIARYMGFSVSTASYHVGAILARIGVSNRAEAAATAVREHLIDERDV